MTTTMHDQSSTQVPRGGLASRILVREMWAAVSIVAMWVTVLLVALNGGEATFHSVDSSNTTIPSAVLVALFAAIGTGSVAKRVFGRRSD